METKNWKIKTPAQIQLTGPSQCGKSELVLKLIANDSKVFDKSFNNIIYAAPDLLKEEASEKDANYIRRLREACHGKRLHLSSELPSLEVIKGTTASDDPGTSNTLLILDDLLLFEKLEGLNRLSSMFAHHASVTVFYLLQNPFQRTKKADLITVGRNLTGRFIFYATNDWRLYHTLNSSLFPEKKNFLVSCLKEAKSDGINYVYVNTESHSSIPRRFMVCTGLFGEFGKEHPAPLFFDLEA